MRTTKRAGSWWVVDVPPYRVDGETFTDYGPYRTPDEADADLAGLTRFYRDHPEYAGGTIPTPAPVPDLAAETPQPETPSPRDDRQRRRATELTQRTLFG